MIIPVQSLTSINGITVDPQSILLYWGPFQAGDEGAPVQVFAYERFAWHFTGYPASGVFANPNVPIMSDRSVTVVGTNDNGCLSLPIFTLSVTDPIGMNNRINDPVRVSHDDGAFLLIKPKVNGTINPAGPDCGLLLFCTKFFGPRT